MFCVCRNGWYHFKLRILCNLTDIVGRSVIQYPHRMRKKQEANKIALELRDRLNPKFQRLRIECFSGTNDEQLRSCPLKYCPPEKLSKWHQVSNRLGRGWTCSLIIIGSDTHCGN